MVQMRDDVVGSTPPSCAPAGVGGVGSPRELLRPARRLHQLQRTGFRARQARRLPTRCPRAARMGTFTEAREFNLMFKTHAGPVDETGAERLPAPRDGAGHVHQLRQRAQHQPQEAPFGIAQIGKSFRNEITPGNFVFRTREFEQMEMEFFVPPDESQQWYEYWCRARLRLVPRPRHARGACCACVPTRTTSCRTIRPAPPTSSSCFPGAGTSSRASPTADRLRPQGARQRLRRGARLLRPGAERALSCPT